MKKPKLFKTRRQMEKEAEQRRLARELMANIEAELAREDEDDEPDE